MIRRPVFHGWWMVAAGSVLQFMQSALLQQSFGAYVAVLRDEMGWSKTSLSAAAVIQQVESALLGPLQGWFVDRFGPKWMIRIGILLFGSGFMLLSLVETLPAFYGAFVVVALGSGLSGFFPLTVALLHWFERKRAKALSAMQLGYAVGGMAVPLVAWSLLTFGWRHTAFASGIFIIVVGLPLATVIRRRPEDHGEVVDGIRDAPADAETSAQEPTRDFTAGEALRAPAFWFISLGHGFALLVVSAVMVHAITFLKEDLGYTLGAASLVIGLMTLCQAAGILLSGIIGDRFDRRLLSTACMLFHMIGMLLLTYAVSYAMLIGFAILHGISWGLRGPLMQAIRADYFGRSSIGLIMGLSSIIVLLGQVSGPMIAGVMADATGDYKAGFTVLAVLAGLGSAFFLLAKKPDRPTQAGAARSG